MIRKAPLTRNPYFADMTRSLGIQILMTCAFSGVGTLAAQSSAPDSTKTTGGLSAGLSGFRSNDGTTIVGDLMWVGAELNDGIGVRVMRQGLARREHGYAAMIVIGGPPRDSLQWLRLDFGLGYVGQQADRSLKPYQRHGLGALFGATIAPVRVGIVKPELNGWAVVGTSARFLGVSLGVRVRDPRQR